MSRVGNRLSASSFYERSGGESRLAILFGLGKDRPFEASCPVRSNGCAPCSGEIFDQATQAISQNCL